VRAAVEIEEQARAYGIERAWLIAAAGSGGTLAGLWAGLTLINSKIQPLGIDVGSLWRGFPNSIARMASQLCEQLGEPHTFSVNDVPLIEHTYVGQGYAIPSAAGRTAIERLARLEGLVTDPIYTGKALAGLLDLVAKGQLGADAPVIFLHTGGLPGLFRR
jgi:1-aminocyclopropane-1-carboxylate deaminase/D-cysteine desulfhydrase-like pyridoxal-dependent ACC family enzyme